MKDKWSLDTMPDFYCQGKIKHRLWIEPATLGIQIWCSPYWGNRNDSIKETEYWLLSLYDRFFYFTFDHRNIIFSLVAVARTIFFRDPSWNKRKQFTLTGTYMYILFLHSWQYKTLNFVVVLLMLRIYLCCFYQMVIIFLEIF